MLIAMFLAHADPAVPGSFGLFFILAEIVLILCCFAVPVTFIIAFVAPLISIYGTRWEDWLNNKEEERKRNALKHRMS